MYVLCVSNMPGMRLMPTYCHEDKQKLISMAESYIKALYGQDVVIGDWIDPCSDYQHWNSPDNQYTVIEIRNLNGEYGRQMQSAQLTRERER